jgi:hypothetical protein
LLQGIRWLPAVPAVARTTVQSHRVGFFSDEHFLKTARFEQSGEDYYVLRSSAWCALHLLSNDIFKPREPGRKYPRNYLLLFLLGLW